MLQVGWTGQPVWKETTCMARQSEEDDTLKLEVKIITAVKKKDRKRPSFGVCILLHCKDCSASIAVQLLQYNCSSCTVVLGH